MHQRSDRDLTEDGPEFAARGRDAMARAPITGRKGFRR
jgi:hypothetical protein